MFARVKINGRRRFIMDLNPVGAHIHPPLIWISGNNIVACANISTTVPWHPSGSWKLEKVNFLSHMNVFHYRAILDLLWWHKL